MKFCTANDRIIWGVAWLLLTQAIPAAEIQHYVVPHSRAADISKCVAPTTQMRRQHMEFIKHQRFSTVHQGIRNTRYSLANCIDCHVQKNPGQIPTPINRQDQFCGACHAYAAVRLDCFDCHAAVPTSREDQNQVGSADQRSINHAR